MAKRLKPTYTDATNKHAVREFYLQRFQFQQVVGLAGPDINEYISFLKNKGCESFEIYERDMPTLVKQLSTLKESAVHLKYDDILKADANKENTLYDLDFCVSVRYMKDYISKFKDNFIMTFSTRIGVQETINRFFEAREEQIASYIEYSSPIKHTIFKTQQDTNYLFTRYRDTSGMCCFAKI